MCQTKVVENIKIHILYSIIFFFEKCAVYEIRGKILYTWAGQDENMAHAHSTLDT
jgi:hypothetical protein